MDLFADYYYELDSLNKINYYNILHSTPSIDIGTHEQVNSNGDIVYTGIVEQNINAVLVATTNTHIKKADGMMCHETQITDTIKKIILE